MVRRWNNSWLKSGRSVFGMRPNLALWTRTFPTSTKPGPGAMPWAGLARAVGAEENVQGSQDKTRKKREHLQYEIFITLPSTRITNRIRRDRRCLTKILYGVPYGDKKARQIGMICRAFEFFGLRSQRALAEQASSTASTGSSALERSLPFSLVRNRTAWGQIGVFFSRS